MRLLIVGTLDGHISAAGRIARARGATVTYAESGDAALEALRLGRGADLLMIDVAQNLPSLIEALRDERFHIPVVACGIGTDARAAVRAIQSGAKEYVPLPPDAELIAAVLEAVASECHDIINRDPAMARILALADQIAPSDASVLITGESGTGKELMARHLHRKSKRRERSFISVNCAAIPDQLLESELFGHEKGAFTGAVARRIGKFEEAQGGTLLLDEISEMDARLQAKLLRAIQEREIDRVGGTQPVKVDIRVLATSNRNMEEAVRTGRFREDLYYRLNVVTLRLPALRERPEDIAPLSEHFIAKYVHANGLGPKRLSPETVALLARHDWPGNVRELENTMHRAVLLAPEPVIEPAAIMLPDAAGIAARPESAQATMRAGGANGQPGTAPAAQDWIEDYGNREVPVKDLVGRTVAEVERDLILQTLEHTLGNRTHAANILGISIRTLRNKLKLYSQDGIPVPPPYEPERASL